MISLSFGLHSAAAVAVAAGLPALADLCTTAVGDAVTVRIDGLPEGAVLSAGVQGESGAWLLNGDQLAGLTLLALLEAAAPGAPAPAPESFASVLEVVP